jgi:hypothetical protein
MSLTSRISRKTFLINSSLTAFALSPVIIFLSGCLDVDEKILFEKLGDSNDEFHFFDNNLTNLHFYFINAKISKKQLVLKTGKQSFMIVKIPQQHISEELLREGDLTRVDGKNQYLEGIKNTDSKISGFSYLAFNLYPGDANRKRRIDLSDLNALLDWDNKQYFELIVPNANQYAVFESDIEKFNTNKKFIIEKHDKETIIDFYKRTCTNLFKVNDDNFPVTLLEIPQGLFVTPYTGNDSSKTVKAVFSKPPIDKKQFIYNSSKGKVVRSVQEIWNSQMWFQQFEKDKAIGDKYDASLRPVGYTKSEEICTDDTGAVIICPETKDECPKNNINFLPSFLDKQELTYIASLGRENANSKGPEWNIETKGLTFTGLGAIAKFHYKNYTPPTGTDLAEYEHHITLGRDEFIKVARIGVISCTGQRALHVKIGQRKIKEGISYMEFKEYIEIIQKEIVYFNEKLFIENPIVKEPANFIQARNYPSQKNNSAIIHSIDVLEKESDDVWKDNVLWNLMDSSGKSYLPDHPFPKPYPPATGIDNSEETKKNWHTHYRRWPFKNISFLQTSSKPILHDAVESLLFTAANCDCAEAFWPVLENTESNIHPDYYLDFIGYDWNDQQIHFSSTFLFIRKKLIECPTADFNSLYTNHFINQSFERRHIQFTNSSIAFTPDYNPIESQKEQLPNKYNVAKTDFLEYYFSICQEPTGSILESKGSIIFPDSIFNERFFPIYPQVKRSALYLDGLPESLLSVIEYNDDYINTGFTGKRQVNKSDGQPLVGIDSKPVETIYNKARIIFNHTDKFIQGTEDILQFDEITKKWTPKPLTEGYSKIKQAFSGAGDKIGGLVNPDFDIQCIGLVKQSISVGKKINEKYKDATDFVDKIEKFNPSDLLRQAPEIFHGISLLDILKEVFPEYEAPVNDIKNVASQVESELVNLPIVKKIKEYKGFEEAIEKNINNAKQYLDNLKSGNAFKDVDGLIKDGYEIIQTNITNTENKIKDLKNQLNEDFQFSDIQNLVTNKVDEYKNVFVQSFNDINNKISIDTKDFNEGGKENLLNVYYFIAGRILTNTEKLLSTLGENDIVSTTDFFQNVTPNHLYTELSAKAADPADTTKAKEALQIIDAISRYIKWVNFLLSISEGKNFKSYTEVISAIKTYADPLIGIYYSYKEKIQAEIDAKKELIEGSLANGINVYNSVYNDLLKSKGEYDLYRNDINTSFKDLIALYSEIIIKYEGQIQIFISKLNNIYEVTKNTDLLYVIGKYEILKKDYSAFQSKIGNKKDTFGKSVLDVLNIMDNKKLNNLRDNVQGSWLELQTKYGNDYNEFLKIITANNLPKEKLVLLINKEAKLHQTEIIDYLNTTFYPQITQIKNSFDNIQKLENEINNEVDGLKKQLQDRQKQYEAKLNDILSQKIEQGVKSLKDQVSDFIEYLNDQILNDPSKVELINDLIAAKDLYNKLTALTQKEINFNWQTTSLKNADFGIVAFLASDNPKTTLSVNVKNTIYFQPNKFPSVISKVETLSENKLSNFGLSLLSSMIINFNEVSFTAGTNQSPKFDVKIRDVQFAGALSFVQAFESWLQALMGDAFRLKLQPDNVNIGYTLPIPSIQTPGFNFFNLTLNFDFWLYFNNKPLELGFSLARKDDKFGMAVGIYAGFGFFGIKAEPKRGITEIEIGFEFGGYFGLSLGPLRGEVKLVVGLYYKKDKTGVTIEGYFLCEGRVQLWFVMINARFYMGIKSQNNYVEGRCTVSYEIKLGCFFKLSFQASYYKKLAGATPGNDTSGSNQSNTQLVSNAVMMLPQKDQHGFVNMNSAALLDKTHNTTERMVLPLSKDEWRDYLNTYN